MGEAPSMIPSARTPGQGVRKPIEPRAITVWVRLLEEVERANASFLVERPAAANHGDHHDLARVATVEGVPKTSAGKQQDPVLAVGRLEACLALGRCGLGLARTRIEPAGLGKPQLLWRIGQLELSTNGQVGNGYVRFGRASGRDKLSRVFLPGLFGHEIIGGPQRPPGERGKQLHHALHVPCTGKVLGLMPRFGCPGSLVVARRALLGLPTPHAVPAVGHAGRRRGQQAPVDGPPHVMRRMTLARLVRNVVFVRRLEIDDRPTRMVLPRLFDGAGMNPGQRGIVVPVAALITEDV